MVPPPSLILRTLEPGPIGSVWRPTDGSVPWPGSRQTSGGVDATASMGTKSAYGSAPRRRQGNRNAAERLARAPHARRLRRLGWARALSPPDDGLWTAGEPPPRRGCSLEVIV